MSPPPRTARGATPGGERLSVRLGAGSTPADAYAVATRPGESGAELASPSIIAGLDLTGVDLLAVLARESAKGEPGEVVPVPLPAGGTVFLVGTGSGDVPALRRAAAALVRRARSSSGVGTLRTTLAWSASPDAVRAVTEALLLASYTFSLRSEPKPATLRAVELLVRRSDAVLGSWSRGVSTATATMLARDLINTPSELKTPAWLAAQATRLAAKSSVEVSVSVRDEVALAAEGFGGLIGVGIGSPRPPRLIELRYRPEGARRHVVLVGKGITFDTGGLSIKPNDGMLTMKTDMSGGAAVIAVLVVLAELGVKVAVTGLVAAAENMPSGSAQRPGDVLTQYGGRTVEVLNTDAEGRLVLADALAYADAVLEPDVLVDIATLTGAASLGLGKRHGALFTNRDGLATALTAAGDVAGERLWQMPLVEDYRPALESPVADLRNIGDPESHFSGGAITAALFLREFVGDRAWAHLDIAGPARADKDEDELTKGGTGFAVRSLLRWLESGARA
ncbi:MAG: leucyl aminopeptidase [Frankiales bacterium]|jgi:leucyl aminopeptidase|nr:leucyl aminopeptidase [Frankiales bacterium]